MKYLSNYTDQAITELFKNNGAFFAFGDKQFNEKKKEGVKYTALYGGLVAPSKNVDIILKSLDNIRQEGIKLDIKENGIKNIIWREFSNYECQIVMNYDDVLEPLEGYGISKERLAKEWKAYFKHCIDNDLF
jgi:hypothetical protein|tara:strand:+ start:467 stop:862 length:396 start_codon:yes stop_codon:yes gene_type:complete